jgi:hypothetical protein
MNWFSKLVTHFEKLVHLIKLNRFGGAPNGPYFAPLIAVAVGIEGGPSKALY